MKIITFLLDDQTSCSALGHCSCLVVRIKISLLLQTLVRNWVPTFLSWKEINSVLLREMHPLAFPMPRRVSGAFSWKCRWSQWLPGMNLFIAVLPPNDDCICSLLIASDLSKCCAKPCACFIPLFTCGRWAFSYEGGKGASEGLSELAEVPKPGWDRTEFTLHEGFCGWQPMNWGRWTASNPQENGTYRKWNRGGTDAPTHPAPRLPICEGISTV